jgi:hypothetical protein
VQNDFFQAEMRWFCEKMTSDCIFFALFVFCQPSGRWEKSNKETASAGEIVP